MIPEMSGKKMLLEAKPAFQSSISMTLPSTDTAHVEDLVYIPTWKKRGEKYRHGQTFL